MAETAHGQTDGAPIRVAVVDDQRLFVDGLVRILNAQLGMEVVGKAHDGEKAVKLCLEHEPDVVLMDISMPEMDGVAATRKLRDLLPSTSIVILTVHSDDSNVFRGIKAGALGYLLKDCTPEDLTHAIRTVHSGHTIMAPDIAQKMLATFEDDQHGNPMLAPRLTERELEVIKSLALGKSNKEIAQELDIAEKTVRNHASNIYRKLHIFDRTQAVIYAIRKGLVDINDLDG